MLRKSLDIMEEKKLQNITVHRDMHKGHATRADLTGHCIGPTRGPVRLAPALHGPT